MIVACTPQRSSQATDSMDSVINDPRKAHQVDGYHFEPNSGNKLEKAKSAPRGTYNMQDSDEEAYWDKEVKSPAYIKPNEKPEPKLSMKEVPLPGVLVL